MRQKCSRIHKGFAALFDTSDEKSDGAIPRLELCGIALTQTAQKALQKFVNFISPKSFFIPLNIF